MPSTEPGLALRVLRTPLLIKLVVLDALINAVALFLMRNTPPDEVFEVSVVSLVVVLVLNAGLVAWALQPLQILEEAARRVSRGEHDARVAMPSLADSNLVRIGATLNALLDAVGEERARVKNLAAQVVAAGDTERAHIARELHDGTAQSIAALEMLLASMIAEQPEGKVRDQAKVMHEIATEALAEVRALSHAVHPRALDELGLAAALHHLGRRAREQSGVEIDVDVACASPPSKALSSVLYRVAQESLHNAVKHAQAETVSIGLRCGPDAIELRVVDDGVGFDQARVRASRRGLGLFVMEERLSLVDGTLVVTTSPGKGTDVRARIPLNPDGEPKKG